MVFWDGQKAGFLLLVSGLHVTFDGEGQDLWMSDDAGEGSLESRHTSDMHGSLGPTHPNVTPLVKALVG